MILFSGLDRARLDRAILPLLPHLTALDGRPVTAEGRAQAEASYLMSALRTSVPRANEILRAGEGDCELRIPTLEEFVERPGARGALDKCLEEDYPKFRSIAAVRGYPAPYLRFLEQDQKAEPAL